MSLVTAFSLDQALQLVASGARPIAGGSDLVVGARHGKAPLPMQLVAIDRVDELKGLASVDGGLRIGAGTNHATLETDPLVVGGYTALADGSALVGSPATRNVGTIGGNVMNASPAMDTGAPLVVLGATVDLASATARRTIDIAALWAGPGRHTAAADELCVAINLPAPAPRSGSAYVRLEYRRAMEIAVVGAAASVTCAADGSITAVRVALTAVAPTIIEVTGLSGGSVADVAAHTASAAAAQASPISDVRASDAYRRHVVGVLAGRAVVIAAARAVGTSVEVPANRSALFASLGAGASS